MNSPPETPNTRCPLCGAHNQCAIACGEDAAQCWCQAVAINPRALSQLDPDQQATVCICQRCATTGYDDDLKPVQRNHYEG